MPAAHGMHVVAPTAPCRLVSEPAGHAWHCTVEVALYCPALHSVQLTAPVEVSAFVVEPGSHAKHDVCPVLSWYCPAAQTEQLAVESVALPYWPAAHARHLTPSVVDPAAQTAHAVVDTALYCPAVHTSQRVADTAASTSVIEPDGHTAHATVALALYLPAAHAVQRTAPV